MPYTLSNVVSGLPENGNVGFNNSWLKVNNNAGRHLFAQANYITNFDDLSISLSAADLNIGSVHISDPDNNSLAANVVSVGAGVAALRVLTQDLDPDVDTVSLGDINKNNVGVNSSLSALKVYVANTQPISLDLYEAPILDTLSITNVLSSKLTGFYVSNLPIAVLAVTAVANSNATVYVDEYAIHNFTPGISNSGNKQYGLYYRWVKNPTFSSAPSYTTVNNIKYAKFNDVTGGYTIINNSGKTVHNGLLASSNNVSDEILQEFPITGNASPDVYALVVQLVNDVGPTDIWYAINVNQT